MSDYLKCSNPNPGPECEHNFDGQCRHEGLLCAHVESASFCDNCLSLKSFQEHHEAQTRDWENKVAAQTDLLRRAREVVEGLLIMGNIKKPKKIDEALTWRENDYRIQTKAQALLPDLEKCTGESACSRALGGSH